MGIIVKREEITDEIYREMLDAEAYHNHEIIKDKNGTLRWKEDDAIGKIVDELSMFEISVLFDIFYSNKNSKLIRKMYRDIGYSLSGYLQIFYNKENGLSF